MPGAVKTESNGEFHHQGPPTPAEARPDSNPRFNGTGTSSVMATPAPPRNGRPGMWPNPPFPMATPGPLKGARMPSFPGGGGPGGGPPMTPYGMYPPPMYAPPMYGMFPPTTPWHGAPGYPQPAYPPYHPPPTPMRSAKVPVPPTPLSAMPPPMSASVPGGPPSNPKGPFHCPSCRQSIPASDLRRHVREHLDYTPLKCGTCKHVFYTDQDIDLHIRTAKHSSVSQIIDSPDEDKEAQCETMITEISGGKLALPPFNADSSLPDDAVIDLESDDLAKTQSHGLNKRKPSDNSSEEEEPATTRAGTVQALPATPPRPSAEELASTADADLRKLKSLTGKKEPPTASLRSALANTRAVPYARTQTPAQSRQPATAVKRSSQPPHLDPNLPMKRPAKGEGKRVLQTPAKSMPSVLPPVSAPPTHTNPAESEDMDGKRLCKLCKTGVPKSAASLRNHIMSEHVGEYRYQCNMCDMKELWFLSAAFKSHFKLKHKRKGENFRDNFDRLKGQMKNFLRECFDINSTERELGPSPAPTPSRTPASAGTPAPSKARTGSKSRKSAAQMVCKECGELVTDGSDGRLKHVLKKHNKEVMFSCKLCSYSTHETNPNNTILAHVEGSHRGAANAYTDNRKKSADFISKSMMSCFGINAKITF